MARKENFQDPIAAMIAGGGTQDVSAGEVAGIQSYLKGSTEEGVRPATKKAVRGKARTAAKNAQGLSRDVEVEANRNKGMQFTGNREFGVGGVADPFQQMNNLSTELAAKVQHHRALRPQASGNFDAIDSMIADADSHVNNAIAAHNQGMKTSANMSRNAPGADYGFKENYPFRTNINTEKLLNPGAQTENVPTHAAGHLQRAADLYGKASAELVSTTKQIKQNVDATHPVFSDAHSSGVGSYGSAAKKAVNDYLNVAKKKDMTSEEYTPRTSAGFTPEQVERQQRGYEVAPANEQTNRLFPGSGNRGRGRDVLAGLKQKATGGITRGAAESISATRTPQGSEIFKESKVIDTSPAAKKKFVDAQVSRGLHPEVVEGNWAKVEQAANKHVASLKQQEAFESYLPNVRATAEREKQDRIMHPTATELTPAQQRHLDNQSKLRDQRAAWTPVAEKRGAEFENHFNQIKDIAYKTNEDGKYVHPQAKKAMDMAVVRMGRHKDAGLESGGRSLGLTEANMKVHDAAQILADRGETHPAVMGALAGTLHEKFNSYQSAWHKTVNPGITPSATIKR